MRHTADLSFSDTGAYVLVTPVTTRGYDWLSAQVPLDGDDNAILDSETAYVCHDLAAGEGLALDC